MKRRGIWLGILALALVLAAVILTAASKPPEVTLPSGTTLCYFGATRADQPLTSERWIDRMGRKYLPSKLQGWIPPFWRHAGITGRSNSVAMCFPVVKFGPRAVGVPERIWAVAEDDSGYRFPSQMGYQVGIVAGDPYLFVLDHFPRRQKRFQVHLQDNHGQTLGSVSVRNPLPTKFPVWKPTPMPASQTNGSVGLTLHSIKTGRVREFRVLQPEWTVHSSDPRWATAKLEITHVSDATGNHGPPSWREACPYSPAESAWKFSVRLSQKHRDSFPEAERTVASNLDWPREGQKTSLKVTTEDGRVFLGSIVCPARLGANPPKTMLHLTGPAKEAGEFLLVSLIDDAGGVTALSSSSLNERPGEVSFMALATLRPGTRPKALEIIVSRPMEFEFLVDPKAIFAEPPVAADQ